MLNIAIITDDPGWHGRQLLQAFAARDCVCHYVSLTHCRLQVENAQTPIYMPGFEQVLPDAVFVRGVPGGSLEEVVFYLDILHVLQHLGVPVYNNTRGIELSVDKGMTSILLHSAGLPTPRTWVCRDPMAILNIAEQQLANGHFLISKPLFGSQGEGIRRLEKSTDLLWLTSSQGIYYLQEFIHCAGDTYFDYRVFVINGRVIATMRRQGISWLNNVARGASCAAVVTDPILAELAIQATAAVQLDYAGVDIIQDNAGHYCVIEVNSVPAWKGLQSVVSENIAAALVNDVLDRLIVKSSS